MTEGERDEIAALCAVTQQRGVYAPDPDQGETVLSAASIIGALQELDRAGVAGPLQVRGVRVVGSLFLPEADLPRSLGFDRCAFDEPVVAEGVSLRTLAFTDCEVPILNVAQLRTARNLNLVGLRAGLVHVGGAQIDGQLALRRAQLDGISGMALVADWIDVRGDLFCDHGFAARGQIRLPFARVGASVSFDDATITVDEGEALVAHGATIAGDLNLGQRFRATGEVHFVGAEIGGDIDFSGSVIEVREGEAITADRTVVRGAWAMQAPFSANGSVRLPGAEIAGQFVADGATIENAEGEALMLQGTVIKDDCRLGVQVRGGVLLDGARIDGQLIGDGAVLDSAGGPSALSAQSMHVGGLTSFEGTTIIGLASFEGARFDESLQTDGADLGDCVIDATAIQAESVVLRDWARPPRAIGLANATIGLLADAPREWPAARDLDGLVYRRLDRPVDVTTRLGWIHAGMSGFEPQVFDQLASYYLDAGREEDAREVLVAKQKRRRIELAAPARVWSVFLEATVGFGYRTHRAAIWLAGFLLIGWAILGGFWFLHDPATSPTRTRGLPGFHPLTYTLDLLLPVVDLGQRSAYTLTGAARWIGWTWTLAGWLLTTAVAAALARRFNRS